LTYRVRVRQSELAYYRQTDIHTDRQKEITWWLMKLVSEYE